MSDTDLITRIYSGFRGVDFRGDEVNLVRSPDSLNVWKDYKKTESISTRPDTELVVSFDDAVYGIFFYKTGNTEMQIIHSGTSLYKIVNGTKTLLKSGVNAARSDSFVYNSIWYFKDGKNYLQYDGSIIKDVEGYIPTTSIGRAPTGGGETKQDVNLLSDYRINTFVGDGVHKRYYLDAQNIDKDFTPEVTVDSKRKTTFTVDYTAGTILFDDGTAPDEPETTGQANVSIKFKKTVSGYADRIKKCTLLQVFDNRVFFSGNPEFPNRIFHCSLDEPSYCSDLDYYDEGLDTAKVTGMVAGNNVLWVLREPSQANTTVFYHTPIIDSDYGKIYPSTHSSISTGCVGKAINFNDDIVFFSNRGMEGISGDITTEQAISHRSSLVDSRLVSERNYKDMILEEWEGYLLIFIDNKVYLADSRAVFTNENHLEYEWFYWELSKNITCTKVNDGLLYLGTEDGVYTLTDVKGAVESYWVTPKDKFKYPHKLKTTNKRGCTVEAEGDVSVYAKTEGTEFELIGKHEGVTDYFVSRIKRKKFKDIQLKFHSKTRFSLETATLECFIGGYIKR